MKKLVVLGSVALSLALAYGCSGGTSDVGPSTGGDGGGADGGSTSTTDSGTSSTADSGNKPADSGSTSDTGPADSGSVLTGAALKFHSCPPFAACGGNPQGTWEFTGGCLEDPLAAFKAQCASLVEKNLQGTIKGSVMFTGTATAGTLTRNATVGFVADVEFAASCAGGFGCAAVPLGIGSFVPGATATCTGAATCACKISVTNTDSLSSGYTVAGNSIRVSNGEVYEHCITGSNLKYKQTAGPDGGKPNIDGTFDLVKK